MFKDLTVLEVANVLAGPAVGMFFAELGARVIKVENPSTGGDTTRHWKLPSEPADADVSSYFSSVNWGKKSIGVAFNTAAGRQILHDLARKSDILVQSFKAGDDERFGLDYETIKAVNPRLIYAQITAYGPHDKRTGFDAIIQAESGFSGMNGTSESGPIKMPVALIDLLLAHQLKEAILLALIRRMETGEGSFVTISLMQAAVSSLANQATNYLVGGTVPQRTGSDHPNIVPYGTTFRTRDQHDIVLGIGTDTQFRALCSVLRMPELAEDERYATNQNRVINKQALNEVIAGIIGRMDKANLLQSLAENRVPAGAVHMMDEVFEQPEARSLLLSHDKSGLQGLRTIAFESSSADTRIALDPPPYFNQDSRDILQNVLGYSEEDIEAIVAAGALDVKDGEKGA
jgi:crotonobetainyl-CoA:carnitine CoA-transferase CaiB-like acyl-CoA transferase